MDVHISYNVGKRCLLELSNGTDCEKMGRITATIPDELEKKLRLKTLEAYGGKKGDLSKAVEEAITKWVTSKK